MLQNFYYRLALRLWNKFDWVNKSIFLKKICPVYEKVRQVKAVRKGYEQIWKDALVAEINDIILTKHSKLRIGERFGSLSKDFILNDIRNNRTNIIACRDRRYEIRTKENTYIFSDKHHLVTCYPTGKDLSPHYNAKTEKSICI